MGFIERLHEIAGDGSRKGSESGLDARAAHRSDVERELLTRLQLQAQGARHVGSMDPRVRLHLRFTGTVQGVGFRWTNQGIARDSDETGWVRNLEDGSVEIELQAAPADILAHLKALHDYYDRMGCRVWLVEADELAVRERDVDFDVRF